MVTASKAISSLPDSGQLRPFDVRRDLGQIADLVETCFAETLDPDGQRYLQQMRSFANNPGFLRWVTPESGGVPMTGYVWVEDNRLVGNISLIPYRLQGRSRYLIANVAVHPDYRRRGIARRLTEQAIEHVRRRGAPWVWLHVRAQNEGAIRLYRGLGFSEQARRTTWHSTPALPSPALPPGVSITARHGYQWGQQRRWLAAAYPDELSWHLPIRIAALQPGPLGAFYRLFNSLEIWQRTAQVNGQIAGMLAWQGAPGLADHLWLSTSPENEEQAASALLGYLRHRLSPTRLLCLDYPAGRAAAAIQAAGFREHQTLIWMSLPLR
jgi:GNAT superfamily N-acetyltransferase